MQTIWPVLLVLVVFLVILRLKKKRKRRSSGPVYSRRIDGFQVVGLLEPAMPSACLFDHGVQFGRGFRRKEGPQLPHLEGCRCSTLPFSFTGNEVFNGALRNFAEVRCNVPGLPKEAAKRLLEHLKRVESAQLPSEKKAYLAQVGLEGQPEHAHAVIEDFLKRRFEFLGQQPVSQSASQLEGGLAAES